MCVTCFSIRVDVRGLLALSLFISFALPPSSSRSLSLALALLNYGCKHSQQPYLLQDRDLAVSAGSNEFTDTDKTR